MTQSHQQGTAVQTNGLEQPCTNHLNLTRSLADAWGIEPETEKPAPTHSAPNRQSRPVRTAKRPPASKNTVRRFAGYDPTEKRLGVNGGSWR